MNKGKNSRSADNQQVTKKISDDYFSGFIDGEGCFYVGFSKRNDLPIHWQVITEFHVSQNPGSCNVLKALKNRLGCGYLKPNHAKSLKDKSWIFIIKNRNDLQNKLIPFLEKHSLYSAKQRDFIIFKKVLKIIKNKGHLTKNGFLKIVKLVFSNKRQTKKRYNKKTLMSF